MSVRHVLFIHGYSETSLGAYYQFPSILKQALGAEVMDIALSAFNSLDDHVRIPDLAAALERYVAYLETSRGWVLANTAVICHSTGALVARRWILDRIEKDRQGRSTPRLPSHLITVAGANHGSTLAQMGKSVLGYAQKLIQKHILSVGAGVLTDLDYGSAFLLDLNRRWLRELNRGSLQGCYLFSMGGDSIGEGEVMQVFWQLHEPGSDDTVRVSGANLNYSWLATKNGEFDLVEPLFATAHLVLHGYSHFGSVSGILGNVHGPEDPPMAAVLEALSVQDKAAYDVVVRNWAARTTQWSQDNASQNNATVLFAVQDETGAGVADCVIAWRDAAGALTGASGCIQKHSPIQNNVQLSSYSFYINVPNYLASYPHTIQVDASSGSDVVTYKAADYTVAQNIKYLVAPNQFSYVDLVLERDPAASYAMYAWSPTLPLDQLMWPPFQAEGRIVLPQTGGE